MYGRVEPLAAPYGLARLTPGQRHAPKERECAETLGPPTLSEKQVAYAAADAWAGRQCLRASHPSTRPPGYAAAPPPERGRKVLCSALGRARARASLIAMDEELWEEGRHWRGKDQKRASVSRAASKKLTEARRRVAKALATLLSTQLVLFRVPLSLGIR